MRGLTAAALVAGALAAAALVASVLGIATVGRSQSPDAGQAATADRLSGTWVRAIPEAQAQARVERGIAAATADMPPMVDALAARTLRERTTVPSRIHIEVHGDRIRVQLDRSDYDSRAGHPTNVPAPGRSGETLSLVQHFRGDHLEQVFTADGGRRWNTLRVGDDGQLELRAVIQSERLPAPMRFTIPYRRAP